MINLLPSRVKQELQQEQRSRLVLVLLSIFAIGLVCFALMLGVIKVYGMRVLLAQESKIGVLQEKFSKGSPILSEIQAFNEKVSQISRFLKSEHLVSPILESLETILPAGTYLISFDYDPPGRISVTGFAKTREILFAFRENLQKTPLFSNLSFPPSNWVQPQDVRFSLQASVIPSINSGLDQ